jgi:O-antigen biosynthesis protein
LTTISRERRQYAIIRRYLSGEAQPLTTSLDWRKKRLRYLWNRVSGSFAQRGMRGTLARIAHEFKRRPQVDQTLHLLPLDGDVAGLVVPDSPAPLVSIVIPVHGKLEYTVACLRSIALHGASAAFEVIVVDDASPDKTPDVLRKIQGLHVLSNERNLGFVGSCNAGARQARGDYLLFLNNDTQVTSGWLDALLQCFTEEPDCGIAGSRLVYPDGRLQEAGGWVFTDGRAWNVGRFEPRNAPAFRYRRQTDYVSGASLMIGRELFYTVGGFDDLYAPAYYEDTDLAFAVRAAGLKVFYEPDSVVVHLEGISAGTDLDRGMKRYQKINQAKFVGKWRQALAGQPAPDTSTGELWNRYTRGHVLVVDTMTPDPTRDSGSLRLCGIMNILHEEGWRVSFAPDDSRAEDPEVALLGKMGTEVLCRPWVANVPHWLRQHGKELTAVILSRHTVAGQYAAIVRRYAPQATLIFDTVDLHFLREQRAAELSGNATMIRQSEVSRRSELALIEQSDVTFVVSPHERELLAAELPGARVELLSNIHDVHGRKLAYAGRRDLVFIGGYGHPPNSDAMNWMASELLPALRAAIPDMRIHVLGDIPDAARRELAAAGLDVHGRVAELAPWLESCLASIAPLRFGAGVKGKINMAMSYGVPVVATPVAVEGMSLRDEHDVLVANDAAAFVTAVMRLREDEALWNRLSEGALANVKRYFSRDAAHDVLRRVILPLDPPRS